MEGKFEHLKMLVDCCIRAEKRSILANLNVSIADEMTKTTDGPDLAKCMAIDVQESARLEADEAHMNLMDEISRVLKQS